MRSWGRWTEVKLDALFDYLRAFTAASAKAHGSLYLDLFAGVADNESRDGRRIAGSPRRALEVKPELSKLLFFELAPKGGAALEKALKIDYPDRDFEVIIGDCNANILTALNGLPAEWRWAPTFAFVDQYAAEVTWSTLAAIASFKHIEARTKAEIWMLFPDGFIPRGAFGVNEPRFPEFASRVDRMYGTTSWRFLREQRQAGILNPGEFRNELTNLMRWQLQENLGYKNTLALSVPNEYGAAMYTMVFATDHLVGDKIMKSVLGSAASQLTGLRRAKRAETVNAGSDDTLFPLTASMISTPPISPSFEPPQRPYWID